MKEILYYIQSLFIKNVIHVFIKYFISHVLETSKSNFASMKSETVSLFIYWKQEKAISTSIDFLFFLSFYFFFLLLGNLKLFRWQLCNIFGKYLNVYETLEKNEIYFKERNRRLFNVFLIFFKNFYEVISKNWNKKFILWKLRTINPDSLK